jgi:hypothetical protein
MSADKQRKPESALRLVKSPDPRPAPADDSELKAVLDDMNRRCRVQREREARDDGGKDAA